MKTKLLKSLKVATKLSACGLLLQVLFMSNIYAETENNDKNGNTDTIEAEADVIITGKVTDETGEGLPGASIVIKGTTNGITSDMDGNYKLTVPEDAVILISFIGYNSQEISVAGRSVINVVLNMDVSQLEEVVVVGYGTQKKKSLTAAVAVIGDEEIQTTVNVSLAQKLSGKVAGLQIRAVGGQPGKFDNDINIRGFGKPLYVIDGIRREGGGEFQRLNPQDIESITVLKDAAAAIYGLGAANGVILVTTKRGQAGKAKFNYNVVMGSSKPTDIPAMANAGQYMEMWNDANTWSEGYIQGKFNEPEFEEEEVQKWIDGTEPGYEGTDWYDETMKERSFYQQHNLTMSGGTEKTSYFVGLGFVQDNGLLKSNDMGYERYNLRSNLTTDLTKNLEAQLLVAGRWDKRDEPGDSYFNIFKGTRRSLPTNSPYANNNPDYPTPVFGDQNPVALADGDKTGYTQAIGKSFQSSLALTYTIPAIKGLSVKGLVSYDASGAHDKVLRQPYFLHNYDSASDTYVPVAYRNGTGSIEQGITNNDYLTLQGFINYNTTIASKHDVGAVFVVEQNQRTREKFKVKRLYDDFYTKDVLKYAGQTHSSDSDPLQQADVSYIGKVNYGYANKYLIEVAVRHMGSYRYGPDNRWGTFPMASVGWRVSEENFMKNNVAFISHLKFRGSYGITGMPDRKPGVPDGVAFEYVPGFELGSGNPYEFVEGTQVQGVGAPTVANQNLTWQTATTVDIGMDIGLWTNKVTLTTDVYRRDLDGLSARPNVSFTDTFGGTLAEENLDSKMTEGFELTLGYTDDKGALSYSISGNFSYSRTMKKHVEAEVGKYTNSMEAYKGQTGNRWEGRKRIFEYAGQFQDMDEVRTYAMQNGVKGNFMKELPGSFKFTDINGDGIIDDKDKMRIVPNNTPRMYFGFTANASWKGLDFNMLWQGAAGHTIYMEEIYGKNFAFRGNSAAYFYDRSRKADPYDADSEWIIGEYPVSREAQFAGEKEYKESDKWRRDASYLRLKSVELGYTLKSEKLKSAVGIESLRVFVSGFNLITFTDPWVKPFDPEKTSGKSSNEDADGEYQNGFNYPLNKTITAGLSINF